MVISELPELYGSGTLYSKVIMIQSSDTAAHID